MAPGTRTPPTNELGHVASWSELGGRGWPVDPNEEVPDLTWPMSVVTYNRMRRDSQVRAVLWGVFLPMSRPIWEVDPRSAREEVVVKLADDLGLPVAGQGDRPPPARTRGRFSWHQHLRWSFLSFVFGHMPFEQVYTDPSISPDGLAHLRKLAPRFPVTLSHIDVASDGGLTGIRQWVLPQDQRYTGAPEVEIPVDRLVMYCHDREGASWQGQSLLRCVYKDWVLLDRLVRVRAMTIERNGMGTPIAMGAPNDTQAEINALTALAQGYRAGEYSGGALKNGQDLRFRGVEGSLPNATEAIADHRTQIARAFLEQFLQLGTSHGSSGNRALGNTFVDFFTAALDSLTTELSDVMTDHIAEDWVDVNYGEDEPAPAIRARPVDADADIDAASLFSLVQAGVILPDDVLEDYQRSHYNLPAADKRTARNVLPANADPPPAPPAPAPTDSAAA